MLAHVGTKKIHVVDNFSGINVSALGSDAPCLGVVLEHTAVHVRTSHNHSARNLHKTAQHGKPPTTIAGTGATGKLPHVTDMRFCKTANPKTMLLCDSLNRGRINVKLPGNEFPKTNTFM